MKLSDICILGMLILLMQSLGCSIAWNSYLQQEKYAIQDYAENIQEVNMTPLLQWGEDGGKQIRDGKTFRHFQFANMLKGTGRYLDIYIPTDNTDEKLRVEESPNRIESISSVLLLINIPRRRGLLSALEYDFSGYAFSEKQNYPLLQIYPDWVLVHMIQDFFEQRELNSGKISHAFQLDFEKGGISFSPNSKITTIQKDKEWMIQDGSSAEKYLIKEFRERYAAVYNRQSKPVSAILHMEVYAQNEVEHASLMYGIRKDKGNSFEWTQQKFKWDLAWRYRSHNRLVAENLFWYFKHLGFLLAISVDIACSPIWLPVYLAGPKGLVP